MNVPDSLFSSHAPGRNHCHGESEDAYTKAVHKPVSVSSVTKDPRGNEDPDCEYCVGPTEDGRMQRPPGASGSEQEHDRPNDPRIPGTWGVRGAVVGPRRYEKPEPSDHHHQTCGSAGDNPIEFLGWYCVSSHFFKCCHEID